MRRIHAAIVVEKEGHKAIIIGSGGSKMKQIATALVGYGDVIRGKVYLEVWVKVRGGWTNDEAALNRWAMAERTRQESREAFILHGYAYRETSLLLEAFTRPFDGSRWWRGERAARARLCAGCCSLSSRSPCPGSARANCARSRAPSGSADNPASWRSALVRVLSQRASVAALAPRRPARALFSRYWETLRQLTRTAVRPRAAFVREGLLKELGYA